MVSRKKRVADYYYFLKDESPIDLDPLHLCLIVDIKPLQKATLESSAFAGQRIDFNVETFIHLA
jgi:hypothetical protein